jgi:hypothetical protein
MRFPDLFLKFVQTQASSLFDVLLALSNRFDCFNSIYQIQELSKGFNVSNGELDVSIQGHDHRRSRLQEILEATRRALLRRSNAILYAIEF